MQTPEQPARHLVAQEFEQSDDAQPPVQAPPAQPEEQFKPEQPDMHLSEQAKVHLSSQENKQTPKGSIAELEFILSIAFLSSLIFIRMPHYLKPFHDSLIFAPGAAQKVEQPEDGQPEVHFEAHPGGQPLVHSSLQLLEHA